MRESTDYTDQKQSIQLSAISSQLERELIVHQLTGRVLTASFL
jgi:hypothetical protein